MSKSKRILSFLMAVMMLSSIFSVMASAKANYIDLETPNVDDLDQTIFTPEQCSSMLLDYVDKMLYEMNQEGNGSLIIDLSALGTLNLTSVDNALKGIYDLLSNPLIPTLGSAILGDLSKINASAISTYRRVGSPSTDDKADLVVIQQLILFLSDNKSIIAKVVDHSLSLGAVSSFVDLSTIDVNKMAKTMLYQMVHPETKLETTDPLYQTTPDSITDTADDMIQLLINNLVIGKQVEDPVTHVKTYDGLVPQLAGHESVINIVNSTASAYDFGEELLRNAYNLIAVPMLNKEFKKVVREVCGYVYDDPQDPYNGHPGGTNEYANILNVDFTVPTHDFSGGKTLVSELNNIFAEIIGAITQYTGWKVGDNSKVLGNLTDAAKFVLEYTGNEFFKDYIKVKSQAEIEAMDSQQVFSYIARSVINSSISYMNIPDDADSLMKVVWYAAKEVCAQDIPQNNYSAQTPSLDSILYMLSDIAVYYLNQTIDMNPDSGATPGTGLLPYGQGFDATLTSIMNWVKLNYGGIFSKNLNFQTTDSGWVTLDKIILSVVPLNWLPVAVGSSQPSTLDGSYSKELIVNRIMKDGLGLETSNIFALANHRADSDFANTTIKKVLIDSVARLFNVVFPGDAAKSISPAFKTTYTTFDQIIDNAELKGIIESVLGNLDLYKDKILPAVLPLIASTMGLSSPEEYVDPDILLPTKVSGETTFKISNNSKGVNTYATNLGGYVTKDSLYKIKIDSISVSVSEGNGSVITTTPLQGYTINGGLSANCTLKGTFVQGAALMFTMKYFVLGESGESITGTTPLTTMAFSYITGATDDGNTVVKLDPKADNYHTLSYKNNLYLNQDYNLKSLADEKVTITRNPDTASSPTNTATATVTRTSATPNTSANLVAASNNTITTAPWTPATDNITTDNKGGTWNRSLYAVGDTPTRPADGKYDTTFVFNATKTNPSSTDPSEEFTVNQTVIFYNDHGLPALINSELNAKRDPSNYSDPDLWNSYITALMQAIAVQYAPRNTTNFLTNISRFENAANGLKEAATALKTCEVASGVDSLQSALDGIESPNKNLNYYDKDYKFFGMSDYVPYTYLRYEEERDAAQSMIDSQTSPKEPVRTDYTTQEAYDAAVLQYNKDLTYFNEHRVNLKPVDIAYTLHRFNLYAGRLVRVTATKARLTETITQVQARVQGYTEANCSATSWAAYQDASEFAYAVVNDGSADIRQSKIDTARDKLIETAKELVKAANYTLLKQYIIEAETTYPQSVKDTYTVDSWTVYWNAYDFAKNLVSLEMSDTTENQTKIDNAANALHDAMLNLKKKPVDAVPIANFSNIIVDKAKQYIYGYQVGNQAVYGSVHAPQGYELVWHPVMQENNIGTYGTGTTIDVTLNGVVQATYTVIIFGDVNGDANIDDQDSSICVNVQNWKIKWDRTTEAYKYFAVDLNKDNNIDTIDSDIITLNMNFGEMLIDQNTGLAYPNPEW